nr:hypothetical protein [Tanacetum cinerariifolium]
MANKNVPTPAPTRFNDQILPFAAWVPIKKSNFVLDLQRKQKNPIFQISVDILQNTNFFRAFTASAFTLSGLSRGNHFVSRMTVNNMYQPWRAILSMINQCLTGLVDKANLGSPTKKGKKTKPHVIPYYRFTKLIIYYFGRLHNIHQRSGSPLNLAEDDLSLGNLKFVPKAEKEGGKKKTAPKAYKPVKPAPAKQAKPTTAKQPNPKPLIDEPDEEQDEPESDPELQGAGEEYDLERAIQMREYVYNKVYLEEQTVELDEGHAGSDPDLRKSHVALAGPNPEPIHDDFVAAVYPKVHESLKFSADKQVILEDPLSSSETLFSMKIMDDTYTFGDRFFNDKSTEDEPGKQNVDAKVVSMMVASPLLEPFITTTTETTTTTLPLPLPPQQQSTTDSELVARVTALEKKFSDLAQKIQTLDNTTQNLGSRVFTLQLWDLPHKINQTVNEVVKEAAHIAFQAPLRDRYRELPEADMK